MPTNLHSIANFFRFNCKNEMYCKFLRVIHENEMHCKSPYIFYKK